MIGRHSQAASPPTAKGIMTQASVYGATIPRIYGCTMSSPLLIWLNGIRKAASTKKGSKKSGATTYRCCMDALVAHNPIQHIMSVQTSSYGLGLAANKVTIGYGGASHTIVDADFHQLLGVTVTIGYNVTFNDYGAQGSANLFGTYELPLWNMSMQGPDPINPSGYRWAPWTYFCAPGSGVVTELPTIGGLGASSINIYYTHVPRGGFGAHQHPLPYIFNCVGEPSLGDGSGYTGYKDFSAQRIVYPMFYGITGHDFDIGAGTAPQIRLEVLGSYSLYPDTSVAEQPAADADFADMVEDIFKQGMGQGSLLDSGVGQATASTPIQVGTSCWEFPGTVQKKFWSHSVNGNFPGSLDFDLPVSADNILVVAIANSTGSGAPVVSDLGNTWTPVLSAGGAGFSYATVASSGPDTVSITGASASCDVMIFEIAGCDIVDASVTAAASTSSIPTASITTTNIEGQSGYILTWVFPDTAGNVGLGDYLHWSPSIAARGQGGNFYNVGTDISYAQYRVVRSPGSFTFTGDVATASWQVVMLALKNSVAPAYPKPFGNILDQASLDLCRAQCRANGLWGSLNMNSQKKAADWLDDLYTCMDSAFVWSGFKGKSIPMSEVSTAGNGAIYTAPTSTGPVANLGEGDFIGASGNPMVTVVRKAVVDRPDLLRVQCIDRGNTYHPLAVSQPDQGGLTLYGLRYASPKVLDMIQNAGVARMILGVMVRRENYILNTYKFKLQARWKLLEAMNLVTITDKKMGIINLPVRLTSVSENEKFELDCEAEDFLYGIHSPKPVPVTNNQGTSVGVINTTIPTDVNVPVFLEPPGTLTGVANDQLWIGVSDADPLYGGSVVYVSVDGGTSYNPLLDTAGSSIVNGSAITGFTTNAWAQALDPDTTNDLGVDLTESAGALSQYSATQEDQFIFPNYVEGGGGVFPFELMTYAIATLTGTFQYTLQATGGGSNHLRRGVFGTWASSVLQNTGPAHGINSRFLFIDPTGQGIFKVNVPSAWTGLTLYFKFVQFNAAGTGYSDLASATPYPYTIIGIANTSGGGGGTGGSGGGGNTSYTINPANPLSQTATTTIHMVNVTATFSPSNLQTFYVARNFTIPAPVTPTTYYVTIYDPTLTGDTGNAATLTSFCSTSQVTAHVGQPGYIYMGAIVATSGGTSGGGTGGGSNPPGTLTVQIPIPATTHGNFQIAHGLTSIPNDIDIKLQTNASQNVGIISFQSPVMWDATNVYLFASDDGLIGTLVIEL